ncbi:MAG: undecaprenyl/decaprenyl-phosphate alpha-N-acetylglucosaminyl 1-phosphate transferase [Elusimicrobia bacterium]|nr:undecaprenyl/decaprenyl-phosphate alpha-N-acetylglucosaminyl 1-phosphate transferase [Elusimicrobiota bacterium]
MAINRLFFFISFILLVGIFPKGGFSAWTWTEGVRWLYLFLISFFAAGIFIKPSLKLSWRMGAIDFPNHRKVHTEPKPRIGGVAVYLAFMFALLRNYQFSKEILGIMAGGTVIFLLGFFDDVKGLQARTRLLWQLTASVIVVFCGLYLSFPLKLPFGKLISYAISILWLVGILNAFNFMDGIDGLASSMAAVCALLFLGISWNSSQHQVAFISASLAGACSGFLLVNWHPSKAFLGDCGSTFIGFILGCLAMYGSWATGNSAVALSTPVLVLGIPIFDIIYTTVSRIKNGNVRNVKQWLEYTGRDHFHHRLMKLGMGVREAVGFIIMLNVCLGLAAWTMRHTVSTIGALFLLFQSIIIFIIVVILMLLGREERQ